MVLGYHAIFGAYGFWLPNDPRGSWSKFVGCWELARFGKATKMDTRRSVAGAPHDRRLRQEAKRALKYSPVQFTGQHNISTRKSSGRRTADQSGQMGRGKCS